MMSFFVMFMIALADECEDATVAQAQELQRERQTEDEGLSEEDDDESGCDTLEEILDVLHVYIIAPTQGYTSDNP